MGGVTRSRSKLFWELFEDGLSKALLRFSEPRDLRGAGLLMIEQKGRRPDTFLYLPELGKSRRVSSSAAASSLFGTDFSDEDFERLMGMSRDARRERLEDATLHDRRVWVVAGYPDPESKSDYERVVSWVDPETCVPLRSDSYEPGDKLRKRLVVDPDQVKREGDSWVPRLQVMYDLRDETHTELVVDDIVDPRTRELRLEIDPSVESLLPA
ncbi:MAG: outer membrane lipoprotein-sorting protein [Myxococcota bacterium]|nr:outer membrane lipoprotein-sorting protein [Myxococcota bacterium]